jgi:hypothetical protein
MIILPPFSEIDGRQAIPLHSPILAAAKWVSGNFSLGNFSVEILRFFSPWNSPPKFLRGKFDCVSVCIHDAFMNCTAESTISLYTFGYRRADMNGCRSSGGATRPADRKRSELQLYRHALLALHLHQCRHASLKNYGCRGKLMWNRWGA